MVATCCVPFCKSGYSSVRRTKKKTGFFQFPSNAERKAAWIRAIHRKNFVPSTYSRVCSIHFKEEDFVTQRRDSNPRRHSGPLKKKTLKPDAVPSVFPDHPSYLQPKPSIQRSKRATSSSRLESDNLHLMIAMDSFEEEDTIDSLLSLKTKFLSCESDFGFVLSGEVSDERLVFFKFASDLPPKIVKSIVVSSDLSFSAYDESELIAPRFFENSMSYSKRILRFTDFQNLLACVNNYHSDFAPLHQAIQLLSSYVENSNLDASSVYAKKILFICEQLQLLCYPPGPHHKFSTSLLTTAILWKRIAQHVTKPFC